MYYIATARNHAGEVAKVDTRYIRSLHPVIDISKRKARTMARQLARAYNMRGKLKVTVECVTKKKSNVVHAQFRPSEAPRMSGCPAELAAPFNALGEAAQKATEAASAYEKAAGSIFPVTVKRVDSPALTRPRYYVVDANGRTIKAHKIKKEAQAQADRINGGEEA